MSIRIALVTLLSMLLVSPTPPSRAAEPTKETKETKKTEGRPIRALLICGGCCHDYKTQKDILAKGISARVNGGVEWTIAHEGDPDRKHKHSIYTKPEWWKGYDVIVHDECFGHVDDVPFVDGIVKAHEEARLPIVALHCSLHSYRMAKTMAWSEMLGIRSFKHDKKNAIAVSYVAKDSEITKGLDDWTTPPDELYNNVTVYDKTVPLARGKQKQDSGELEAIVAWTNDFKGNRVFCTTLGHGNDTVGDARYLDLVTRGMLWALNKPIELKAVAPSGDSAKK
jgi:type 1 glutamine amidotransferase